MADFPARKRPAKVGDTVQFHCGEGTIRPLIVTHVGKEGLVSGRVVLGRTEEDRTLPAITATQFQVPHDASLIYVEDVMRGTLPGQWDR